MGGASLERYLLTRHRAIDTRLERTIEQEGITQVIEVACGLSPRGWRFAKRYGDRLTYIEADLPDMAERKRTALERMGSVSEHHRVKALDALADDGQQSLRAVAGELESGQGLAIITEGLLGYLPRDAVEQIWRRFAAVLGSFATGRYLSDLHIGRMQNVQVRAFRVLLSGFVRGRVYMHFAGPREAQEALSAAGFSAVDVHPASRLAAEVRGPGSGLAHILEASTRPSGPRRRSPASRKTQTASSRKDQTARPRKAQGSRPAPRNPKQRESDNSAT